MKILKKCGALFLTACTATSRCYISLAERNITGEVGLAVRDYYDMDNEVTFGFDLVDALKLEYRLGRSIETQRTFKVQTCTYLHPQHQKSLSFRYKNMICTVEAAAETRFIRIMLGLDEVHAMHRWLGITADALTRLEFLPDAALSNTSQPLI